MTKKDYELIAGAIKRSCTTVQAREKVAKEFVRTLAADNDRFKGGVFLEACGLKRNIKTHEWTLAD